jgi:hypothetical protein
MADSDQDIGRRSFAMVLATFDNVLVAVEGMPEGSTVCLGVAEEGLHVGGFGVLSWTGARVGVDNVSPRGVRVRLAPGAGSSSTFFIPASSVPGPLSLQMLSGSIERLATAGGALVERALTAA